jgi:hypothetical protein
MLYKDSIKVHEALIINHKIESNLLNLKNLLTLIKNLLL